MPHLTKYSTVHRIHRQSLRGYPLRSACLVPTHMHTIHGCAASCVVAVYEPLDCVMYIIHTPCTSCLRWSTTRPTRPMSRASGTRCPRQALAAARCGAAVSRAVHSTASSSGACHCVCVYVRTPHTMTLHDCPSHIHISEVLLVSYWVFSIPLILLLLALYVSHTPSVLLCTGARATSPSVSRRSTSWAYRG